MKVEHLGVRFRTSTRPLRTTIGYGRDVLHQHLISKHSEHAVSSPLEFLWSFKVRASAAKVCEAPNNMHTSQVPPYPGLLPWLSGEAFGKSVPATRDANRRQVSPLPPASPPARDIEQLVFPVTPKKKKKKEDT